MSEEKQVYRPTVRMDPRFEMFIDEVFYETNLDRNQIIRLALFCAPFSGLFRGTIEKEMKGPKRDCPAAKWDIHNQTFWREQHGSNKFSIRV